LRGNVHALDISYSGRAMRLTILHVPSRFMCQYGDQSFERETKSGEVWLLRASTLLFPRFDGRLTQT
jgi:hypothetical protein